MEGRGGAGVLRAGGVGWDGWQCLMWGGVCIVYSFGSIELYRV